MVVAVGEYSGIIFAVKSCSIQEIIEQGSGLSPMHTVGELQHGCLRL
jgi:hypothetical protein